MCDLLEKARENQGNISYYEVAKRIGIDTALMSRWKNKKSQPNGLHTLELAKMAGLSTDEALEVLKKQNGYARMSLLIMTSTVCSALLLLDLYSRYSVYYVKYIVSLNGGSG